MRVQGPREHPAKTMVSTLWSHTRQGENAARKIAAGGLRFSPNGPPGEAVKGNPTTTVILRVDGGKLSPTTTNYSKAALRGLDRTSISYADRSDARSSSETI